MKLWVLGAGAGALALGYKYWKRHTTVPGGTPGARSVTVSPGNMGTLDSGGAPIDLVLPIGAQWAGGLSGSTPIEEAPGSGAYTLDWIDAMGDPQTTEFTVQ